MHGKYVATYSVRPVWPNRGSKVVVKSPEIDSIVTSLYDKVQVIFHESYEMQCGT